MTLHGLCDDDMRDAEVCEQIARVPHVLTFLTIERIQPQRLTSSVIRPRLDDSGVTDTDNAQPRKVTDRDHPDDVIKDKIARVIRVNLRESHELLSSS